MTLSTRDVRLQAVSYEHGLLAAILCVAAGVRLYDLSLMEFRHDAAYWAIDGQRIVNGGAWPLIGQQVGSVRVPLANGPLLSYLTAIVFRLAGSDPRLVAAVIASANVAGVWLTYRLGRRWYGPRVAPIAATLTAVAPWLVLYGRMLWPQALFPFLVPLLFLTLSRALDSHRWMWFVAYGILLGAGVQLHLSMLPFVAASLVIVPLWTTRVALACVVLGLAIGYAPLLVHDVAAGFPMLRAFASLPSLHAAADSLAQHCAKTVWNFTNVLSGQGLWVSKLAHEQYLPSWIDWAQGAIFAMLLLTASFAVFRWSRRANEAATASAHRADLLLLAFIIVHTAYLLVARSQIHRHYFLVLYPLPFLLIARGLQLWSAHRTRIGRGLAAAVVVGVGLNLATLAFAHRFLQARGGDGDYGTVFADKHAAAMHIIGQRRVYEVTLAVQERLPYAFLFGDLSSDAQEGDGPIASAAPTDERRRFRIVEPAYHALALLDGECVTLQTRGVVVLQPCVERTP